MSFRGVFLAGAAIALATTLASTGAHAATNLLVNGDFETGGFTGWNVNAGSTFVTPSGFDGLYPQSGSYFAALGNVGCCGSISQSVTDRAGQHLQLSFYYMGDGGAPAYLEAQWNGVTIQGSQIFNAPDQRRVGYTQYVFNVIGTGNDTVTFLEQNDPSYDALDNIQLVAVPEPATWAMMLLGVGAIGAMARTRRRAVLAV
jgi:hypothetical protein